MYPQSYHCCETLLSGMVIKNLKFPINKAFKTTDNYKVNQLKGFPVSIYHSVFKNSLQGILCVGVKAEIFIASHCTKGSGEKKRKILAL